MIRSALARRERRRRSAAGVPGLRVGRGGIGADLRRPRAGDRRPPAGPRHPGPRGTGRAGPRRPGAVPSFVHDGPWRRPWLRAACTTRYHPSSGSQSPECHPLRTLNPSNSPVAGAHDTWTSSTQAPGGPSRRIREETLEGRARTLRDASNSAGRLVRDPARQPEAASRPSNVDAEADALDATVDDGVQPHGVVRTRCLGGVRCARHAVQPSARPSMTSSGLTLPSSRSPASSSLRSCATAKPAGRGPRLPPGRRGGPAGEPRPAGRARRAPGRGRRRARSPRGRAPRLDARRRGTRAAGPVVPACPSPRLRLDPPPRSYLPAPRLSARRLFRDRDRLVRGHPRRHHPGVAGSPAPQPARRHP